MGGATWAGLICSVTPHLRRNTLTHQFTHLHIGHSDGSWGNPTPSGDGFGIGGGGGGGSTLLTASLSSAEVYHHSRAYVCRGRRGWVRLGWVDYNSQRRASQ